MKKLALNPGQLRVESFHVDAQRNGAHGTVHAHRAGDEAVEFASWRPNSQCPVYTCATTYEPDICP